MRLPKTCAWEGDPKLYDPATHTLRLPLSQLAGLLSFQIEAQALGPFEFQASLLAEGQDLTGLALSLSEAGLTELPASGGAASAFDERVRVVFPEGAVEQPVTLRIRSPQGDSLPPSSPSGAPFEIIAHTTAGLAPLTRFAKPLSIQYAYDEAQLPRPGRTPADGVL